MDPIVIDPPNFDQRAAWQECAEYVDKCGGLTHEDGEPNWRAAFGADPGVTSCPVCHEYYWAWGSKQRCVKCGFEYPTLWWPSYSKGVSDGLVMAGKRPAMTPGHASYIKWRQAMRAGDVYYWHGFNNPVEDAWGQSRAIDWKAVVQGSREG